MNTKRWLAIAAALLMSWSATAKDDTIYFYNWSEYIPPGLMEEFTKETGIKVVYTTYDSNEAMYAKLKLLNGEGYDLVVPSTYFVSKMANEGLLQKLDKSKLSNFKHLDPSLLDQPYDPENQYSLPYIWGATGIGVNSDEIDPASITSWADLWNPEYADSIMLMNDVREVFHIALVLNGHSGNSTDEKEIEQAYERLKPLVKNVLVYNSDTPSLPYLAGETSIGMLWNGSAYAAKQEDPAITMVYPKEGAIFWVDNIAIPAGAKNVEGAHKLINFLLRPDIAAKVAEEIGYPSPNKTAKELMPADFANDPVVYPSAEVIANGEFQNDIGEAALIYDKYWQKLRAGQ
ncbi:extracellular solute-binding protein [Paraferrimonas sedimenticola]|uniref:Putrescine-binding periplasmic protein n=1 Tax=Paraferrimonas sedimenticola TaxID=375674 RepID=A0AA37VVJ7_9GAMM|nr:extracellular solute-binding protein [Paraferrimonas sedimenticola]GLP96101.1 putrescine-binding periplasmic protein [Paraferrimonas sedimenticola]